MQKSKLEGAGKKKKEKKRESFSLCLATMLILLSMSKQLDLLWFITYCYIKRLYPFIEKSIWFFIKCYFLCCMLTKKIKEKNNLRETILLKIFKTFLPVYVYFPKARKYFVLFILSGHQLIALGSKYKMYRSSFINPFFLYRLLT